MYNDGMEMLNLFQQVTVQVGWKGLIMYKKDKQYVNMEPYGLSLRQCKCKGRAMKKNLDCCMNKRNDHIGLRLR